MNVIAWRYHPEFRIRIQINGTDGGDDVILQPSPSGAEVFRNYGILTRPAPGGLVAFVRQHHNGVNWVPASPITIPVVFAFRFFIRSSPDFFDQGTQTFGSMIFYANNLNAAGAIDSNLAGNTVRLTAAAAAGDPERGALSTNVLSASFDPGDFTALRAGRITPGAAVAFSINHPIAAGHTTAGLDVSLLPKGAYVVRLEGGSPVEERVIFDQQAIATNTGGIIEIYKDAWQIAPQPREYSIDFLSS